MQNHKVKSGVHAHVHHIKRVPMGPGSMGLVSIMIIFGALFFVARGNNPSSSELSYVEYSILGKIAGSVIPASCDSGYNGAPDNHGGTCCSPSLGAACHNTANSCGDYTSGTIVCAGTCSVTGTRAQRSGWGTACSPANVCGRTNTGTMTICNGGANSGQGLSCSVSAPSDSTCIPTNVSISATAYIGGGQSSTVTWSSSNNAAGCQIIKRTFTTAGDTGGDAAVVNASAAANGSLSDGPLPIPATVQGQAIPLGKGYYVAYKTRCWDSSGTMFSNYSSEAITTVGSTKLQFTP